VHSSIGAVPLITRNSLLAIRVAAAVLPVLEIIGRHILEALGDEPEPQTA
jgi:hypothetical protein